MSPRSPQDEPALLVLHDGGQERELPAFRYPIGAGVDVVGRDEKCAVQLVDPKVSRRHFDVRFELRAGGFVLRDLESVNGTFVDGAKVTEPVTLADGALIELGHSQLLFTTQHFDNAAAAISHFKRHGERYRGTMRLTE
ncbi:MAG: FHA domain-containing protein [Phycisphaerales bacterium]|nr:FHA domain-containing protein [Phycisphaerales bacterium]